jgi:hypothetical protein
MGLDEGVLKVEILDHSETLPRLQRRSGLQEGGRGLQIVDELSDGWGASRIPFGKVVWFDLATGPGGSPLA